MRTAAQEVNIKQDKILHKKAEYVCRQLKLTVQHKVKDELGTYSYIMKDAQNRRYVFTCKRFIFWKPEAYGVVSISKRLVQLAVDAGHTLIMLIEQKDDEGAARDYIYTYNPKAIMLTGWENEFNHHVMINFNIDLAMNMEATRRREIQELRVQFAPKIEDHQKDRLEMNLMRFR